MFIAGEAPPSALLPALAALGVDVGSAIDSGLEQQGRRKGLDIRLRIDGIAERLPPAVETARFRVAQEALTNVVRHSGANRVDVEVSGGDGFVDLVVRDDGKGFDVAKARARAAEGASLGLLSMEERVALVGGRLEIESEPGGGTTIRARFPVRRAAE